MLSAFPRSTHVPMSAAPSASTPANPDVVKTYARGDLIAAEGSPGVGCFILLSGRVGVFKREVSVAEFATRGMVFGEISSILARPRTASLMALEPSMVMHLNADLDGLIARHPNVAKTMLISLAQRLEKTTGALWSALQNQAKPAEAVPAAPASDEASTTTPESAAG
jgi:CRP-like cAMP-binding protein